jgi:hypothetical protein
MDGTRPMRTRQKATPTAMRHVRRPVAAPLIATLLVMFLCTLSPGALADQRDFPFTYSWLQAAKGEKEIAYHTRYRKRDRTWQHQLELEYGVSERFSIAPYIVFEEGEGRKLHYAEWKLETRYQLGEYKTNTVLPGLYLEYAKPNEGKGEIEGKLILSHFDNRGRNLSFNYIVEREFEDDAETEQSYSFGYAVPYGRKGMRLGAEFIHELNDGRSLLGPTIFVPFGSSTSFTAGYAFPLNGREGNRAEFRLFAQYHWF